MRRLITYEPWEGPEPYSSAGLRLLDRRLHSLAPLPYTREQLLKEAAARAVRTSIQGMQLKVSATGICISKTDPSSRATTRWRCHPPTTC